jgi:hypothetical protein
MLLAFLSPPPLPLVAFGAARGGVTIAGERVFCHFDRREKSDLRKQVILSKAKDLFPQGRSLSLFGTMLRIGFLAPLVERDSK